MTDYPKIRIDIKLPDNFLSEDLVANNERNRNFIRKAVIEELLKEKAGTGTGALTAKYKYVVEQLSNTKSVYITRPAFLNKGFDFVIHVEGTTFPHGQDNPRHKDIFDDLEKKIASIPPDKITEYRALLMVMFNKIFNGIEPDVVLEDLRGTDENFRNAPGYEYEMILKVVKWFFIEQDICYWNWSGRNMFMNGLRTGLGA